MKSRCRDPSSRAQSPCTHQTPSHRCPGRSCYFSRWCRTGRNPDYCYTRCKGADRREESPSASHPLVAAPRTHFLECRQNPWPLASGQPVQRGHCGPYTGAGGGGRPGWLCMSDSRGTLPDPSTETQEQQDSEFFSSG